MSDDCSLQPTDPTFFGQRHPLAVDPDRVAFSWSLHAAATVDAACVQTAYQLQVARSRAALDGDPPDLWDTRRVENRRARNIAYRGKPLTSHVRLWWRVRVWDQNGHASAWSAATWFETGPADVRAWQAQWIAPDINAFMDEPPTFGQAICPTQTLRADRPALRQTFQLPRGYPRCFGTAWIAGQGDITLELNGRPCPAQPGGGATVVKMPWDPFRPGNNVIRLIGDTATLQRGVACVARIHEAESGWRTWQSDTSWTAEPADGDPESHATAVVTIAAHARALPPIRDDAPRRSVEMQRTFKLDAVPPRACINVAGLGAYIHGVPTDCPQRDERLGWTGDVNLFATTSCWLRDLHGFYAKWLDDLCDAQLDNGCFSNDVALNPNAGPMLGEVLAANGYRTGYIGKRHLLGGNRDRPIPRGPLRMGFDSPTFHTDNCTTLCDPPDTFFWNHDDAKQPYGKRQPDGQTDQAIAFLEDHAAQHADDPFALFVSWHPPHDNGKTPDGCYRDALPPSKQALIDRYANRNLTIRPNVPEQTPQRQQQLRDHYAMCTGIDEYFGRLPDTLDRLDLAEHTLVVFTSDHGDILGAYDWTKPKQIVHDVSSCVPCLSRMPGQLPANTATDLLLGTLDWMPTLLGLLGLDAPGNLHGMNHAAALRSGVDDAAESVPMFLLMPVCNYRGVVTKRYTFAQQSPHTPKKDAGHPLSNVLFDRVADPHQLHNLFCKPAAASVQRELLAQTQAWCDRFDDDWVTFEQIGQAKPIGKWAMPDGDPSTWPTPRELLPPRR